MNTPFHLSDIVTPALGGLIDAQSDRAPTGDTSWLDGPIEQWLIETPTDRAAKVAIVLAVEPPALAKAADQFGRPGAVRLRLSSIDIGPALPRQAAGYLPARRWPQWGFKSVSLSHDAGQRGTGRGRRDG